MNPDNQKVEQATRPTRKKLFSEAALIAGLTAAGYLAACAYQLAYLNTFGIPSIFLSVDSTTVLFTALTLLAWMSAVIVSASLLIGWKVTNWIRIPVMVLVGSLLIIFPFFLLLLDPKYPLISLIGIPVLVVIVIFWIRNLRKHEKNNTEPQDGFTKFLNLADKIFGSPSVLIGLTAFFFVLLGAGFGRISAKVQADFLVSSTDPNVVIITTYKNNFLGLVFDPSTDEFVGGEIKLINQDNLPTTTTFTIKTLKNPF